MKIRWLTTLIVLLTLVISGFAFGHMGGYRAPRGMMGAGTMGWMCGMMGPGMMMGRGMMGHGMMQGNSGCPMMKGYLEGADFYLSYSGELRLTDSQIRSLESIRDSYEKDAIRLNADLQTAMLELDNLQYEDEIDLSKVKTVNKKIETIQTEIRFKNIESFVKAKRTLNKEQLKKLDYLDLNEEENPRGMMHR